jgi:hypothetical protein
MKMEEQVSYLELSKVLSKLESTSRKVVGASVPFLTEMENSDADIFLDIQDAIRDMTGHFTVPLLSEITDKSRQIVLELVDDSDTVIKEISEFMKRSDNGYEINKRPDTFLFNVWSGDVYDLDGGLENLRHLLAELTNAQKIFSSKACLIAYLASSF